MERLQQMKQLAIEEAILLKQNLTSEEVSRLNKEMFVPDDRRFCIYGMATGNCESDRAKDLIQICASKVYIPEDDRTPLHSRILNGVPQDMVVPERATRTVLYTSPLETLIVQKHVGSVYGLKTIDFLKGETEKLEL